MRVSIFIFPFEISHVLQIFAIEGVQDTILLESVLVQNPRLILWSEPDDPEPVYELPADEYQVILDQCNTWKPDETIKVHFRFVKNLFVDALEAGRPIQETCALKGRRRRLLSRSD